MTQNICDSPADYLQQIGRTLGLIDLSGISRFADLVFEAWRQRRRVFAFGNGGSAFTASHMVCDLVKTAAVPGQPRLQAFSLVDNVGLTTAIGNDMSYEEVLSYPLASYAQRDDLAVAISCSGNSPNVLRASEWASENGLTVIALTGFSGGKLAGLAQLHINVPSENYGVIEDLHLSVGHIVAQMLRARVGREAAIAASA